MGGVCARAHACVCVNITVRPCQYEHVSTLLSDVLLPFEGIFFLTCWTVVKGFAAPVGFGLMGFSVLGDRVLRAVGKRALLVCSIHR